MARTALAALLLVAPPARARVSADTAALQVARTAPPPSTCAAASGSAAPPRYQCTPRISWASATASPEARSLSSFLPLAAADSGNTL